MAKLGSKKEINRFGEQSAATIGFEAKLWLVADKLRNNMDYPPFNLSDRVGEKLCQDVRLNFGMPPVNNANYAWIQHFIHHLSPVGEAGFVMAKITSGGHSCLMKITEDFRKYAAEQGIAEVSSIL